MPAPPTDQHLTGPRNESARILVVDDEPTLRMGFRLALTTEDYTVEMAGNGEQALEVIAETPVDLMFLDLRMPGIDGVGVLHHLTQDDAVVPTVLASAHMDDTVVVDALRCGAVDFLEKPVRPNDLRQIARRVLDEEQTFERKAKTGVDPVTTARCLLRRRDPEEALDVLASAPGPLPHLDLWREVAATMASCQNAAPPAPDSAFLADVVSWRNS